MNYHNMKRGSDFRIVTMVLIAILSSGLKGMGTAADFPSVSGPCNLSFPRDHAPHPEYRIEWWYYTGNLLSDEGEKYGFQLTFFRIRTAPAEAEKKWPKKTSAWRTSQVYAAHASLSDISGKVFHHSEKMTRAALQLAGTREWHGRFEVFADGWEATIAPDMHTLFAEAPDFSFSLDLVPRKGPVLHGESGYSRKGEGPGEASCYYSITRLDVTGKVIIGGREKRVRGLAWMDHEFSSAPLSPRLAGWDWFSLQLSDGRDLMVYLMRERSGEFGPVSSGTLVEADGKLVHLEASDFRVQPLSTWKSPNSGAVYPASWLLEILPLDLRLRIVPRMADQEMQTPQSTRVTYWEGSIEAGGTGRQGPPLTGQGYVELTGYAGEVGF